MEAVVQEVSAANDPSSASSSSFPITIDPDRVRDLMLELVRQKKNAENAESSLKTAITERDALKSKLAQALQMLKTMHDTIEETTKRRKLEQENLIKEMQSIRTERDAFQKQIEAIKPVPESCDAQIQCEPAKYKGALHSVDAAIQTTFGDFSSSLISPKPASSLPSKPKPASSFSSYVQTSPQKPESPSAVSSVSPLSPLSSSSSPPTPVIARSAAQNELDAAIPLAPIPQLSSSAAKTSRYSLASSTPSSLNSSFASSVSVSSAPRPVQPELPPSSSEPFANALEMAAAVAARHLSDALRSSSSSVQPSNANKESQSAPAKQLVRKADDIDILLRRLDNAPLARRPRVSVVVEEKEKQDAKDDEKSDESDFSLSSDSEWASPEQNKQKKKIFVVSSDEEIEIKKKPQTKQERPELDELVDLMRSLDDVDIFSRPAKSKKSINASSGRKQQASLLAFTRSGNSSRLNSLRSSIDNYFEDQEEEEEEEAEPVVRQQSRSRQSQSREVVRTIRRREYDFEEDEEDNDFDESVLLE